MVHLMPGTHKHTIPNISALYNALVLLDALAGSWVHNIHKMFNFEHCSIYLYNNRLRKRAHVRCIVPKNCAPDGGTVHTGHQVQVHH